MLKAFLIASVLVAAPRAQAQDQSPPRPLRCDPFRTAVLLDLCKDSVTLSASGTQVRESYANSYTDAFGTTGYWKRIASRSNALTVSWTPLDFFRVAVTGVLGHHSFSRDWSSPTGLAFGPFFQTNVAQAPHVTPALDAKFRLWQGEAFSGEHRLFALAGAQLIPSYRLTRDRAFAFGPFPAFLTTDFRSQSQLARGTLGLQSSHSWRLMQSGLNLISQNTMTLGRTQGISARDYRLESRLLLASLPYGVALGPLVQLHEQGPRGSRIRGYMQVGLAGYAQPFRALDIPVLRGLVLDGAISWLARRHIDKTVMFVAPFFTPIEPSRTRMQLSTRLRYTIEY